MSGEEQRKIAIAYLEGKDGFSQNEKKGWETMKQAADLGDNVACIMYADHLVDPKNMEPAYRYAQKCDINAMYENGESGCSPENLYVRVLANYALANPSSAPALFEKALEFESHVWYRGYYWLAVLAKSAGADRDVVRNYLKHCVDLDIVPEAMFAEYGLEKGVIEGKEAFEKEIKGYHSRKNNEVYIAAVKKNESLALALAMAKLDDKEGACVGKSCAAKIKNMTPETVFEYQEIYGERDYFGSYSYGFRHSAAGYTTVTTGSGVAEIDSWYVTYAAKFKCRRKNDDLNEWIGEMEFTDEVPDARVRISVERDIDIRCGVRPRQVQKDSLIKGVIAKQYNWYKSDITLNNVEDLDDLESEDKNGDVHVFIPFWFFNYKLGKKVVTARVNAYSGEVDFFIDNPFGLYAKNDDVVVGAPLDFNLTYDPSKFSLIKLIGLSILIPGIGGALYLLSWMLAKAKKKLLG